MSFQVEIDKAIKEKRLYFIGDALPVDWYAGFKLWLAHAEAGDAKAQYNVGRCYDRGDGIDQDKEKALYWYLKAAEKKDPRAYFNLYLHYSNNQSNDADKQIADQYLSKAAELQESRALDVLIKIDINKNETESEKLKANVQSFLYKNDFHNTEKILAEAIKHNHDWATVALAAINIEFTNFILTSHIQKDFIYSTDIVNGTSVGGHYVKTIICTYNTEIKNTSQQYRTNISLGIAGRPDKPGTATSGWKRIDFEPNESKKFSLTCGERSELWNYYVVDLTLQNSNTSNQFTGDLKLNDKIRFLKVPFRKPPKVIDKVQGHGWGPDCFVITACCGDVNHPVVKDFRDFRDSYLANSVSGRWTVNLYYIFGPFLAKFIENKPLTKKVLRYFFTFISKKLPKKK